jgi:hypothetical protein
MSEPSHSDIANRAYQIWEREGRPHGRDQDHWHNAERELQNAGAAKENRPSGEMTGAQQTGSRQTGAASPGRPAHPSAPSTTQAAASTTKRTQQAPGSEPAAKSTQTQAGQPSGVKAQQSSSGKAEPPSTDKSADKSQGGSSARKPRSSRQTNP